jgi:hypothetical protein
MMMGAAGACLFQIEPEVGVIGRGLQMRREWHDRRASLTQCALQRGQIAFQRAPYRQDATGTRRLAHHAHIQHHLVGVHSTRLQQHRRQLQLLQPIIDNAYRRCVHGFTKPPPQPSPHAGRDLGSHHLAQHHRQDAAVSVVVYLNRRVHAGKHLERRARCRRGEPHGR